MLSTSPAAARSMQTVKMEMASETLSMSMGILLVGGTRGAMRSVESVRIFEKAMEGRGVEAVLVARGVALEADEGGLGCVTNGAVTEIEAIGIADQVGETQAAHAREHIELALLAFFDDADGAFLVGEVGGAEF